MPTFDPNMSGTNARKAISDEEEFIKFLPAEVQEKTQIWNIVRPAVEESITENATYSQNIDYMQMISDLTNHMIAQGRNIEPLPQLVIKDGKHLFKNDVLENQYSAHINDNILGKFFRKDFD